MVKGVLALFSFLPWDEKDIGCEVSPEDVEPSFGGEGDQTDAIPTSSSSDSLSMSDEPDARATLPTPSDILVSYSTFPGEFVCPLLSNMCVFSQISQSMFMMPSWPCDVYRLCVLERHSVWLLVCGDTGPHPWGKCQHQWLGHNVDDGELSFLSQLPWMLLNLFYIFYLHTRHHFQVNHDVSQNSAKGVYKQMPGSFNFLRKLLYFQTQAWMQLSGCHSSCRI